MAIDDRHLSELLSRALRELQADATAQLECQDVAHDDSSEALMGVLEQIDAVLRRLDAIDQ